MVQMTQSYTALLDGIRGELSLSTRWWADHRETATDICNVLGLASPDGQYRTFVFCYTYKLPVSGCVRVLVHPFDADTAEPTDIFGPYHVFGRSVFDYEYAYGLFNADPSDVSDIQCLGEKCRREFDPIEDRLCDGWATCSSCHDLDDPDLLMYMLKDQIEFNDIPEENILKIYHDIPQQQQSQPRP